MFHPVYDYINDKLFSEKNELAGANGILYGCCIFLAIVPPSAKLDIVFSLDALLGLFKWVIAVAIVPMVSTFFQKLATKVWDKKIEPNFFKLKKNGTKKSNKTKAA